VSAKMLVPERANDAEIRELHGKLQAALERVTKFAEENVARARTGESNQ